MGNQYPPFTTLVMFKILVQMYFISMYTKCFDKRTYNMHTYMHHFCLTIIAGKSYL